MKIRGNTVGTNLRPEVILTKTTALTEEQKAKARENIGAASIDDIKENVDLSNYHTKEEALDLFATAKNVSDIAQSVEKLEQKPQLTDIYAIDTWYGEISNIEADYSGIHWNDQFAFWNSDDEEIVVSDIAQRIPLIQGENIAFTLEQDNVRISVPTERLQELIDASIAKITIYNGETEDVVIINFSWEHMPFQCEDGMTWAEFIYSDYNIDGTFALLDNGSIRMTKFGVGVTAPGEDGLYTITVKGTDAIIADLDYHM